MTASHFGNVPRGERFVQSFWGGELPRVIISKVGFCDLWISGSSKWWRLSFSLLRRWRDVLSPHRKINSAMLFGSKGCPNRPPLSKDAVKHRSLYLKPVSQSATVVLQNCDDEVMKRSCWQTPIFIKSTTYLRRLQSIFFLKTDFVNSSETLPHIQSTVAFHDDR